MFDKVLVIGLNESALDAASWQRIDALTKERINVAKDSPDINTHLPNTDCILTGLGIPVTKENIDNAPNLKYIGVSGTGYGRIDTASATAKNVCVCNISDYSTESVAEFTFGIVLEHLRSLEQGKKQAREKNYSEAGYAPTEIKGKTFGVLGLGNIGTRVGELALAFGADVRYWSRNRKPESETKGMKYGDADSVIAESDFLSLHFAHVSDTDKFLNEERFQKLKPGCIVINTAPMELVDLDALERRLAKGDITFILDHPDEMEQSDINRIDKFENCIIYPPIGYVSKEASVAKQRILIENMENFLKGTPTKQVN